MVSGNGGGALTIYERMPDPVSAIKSLGTAIAKSGMFGVAGEKQGEVLAWECLARRVPPLTLAESYHVIHGKLSMKADKMLANFNEAGGKHKILSRTADKASIELTIDGESQVFTLTWEDAQQEPFAYNGKESDVVPILTSGDEKKKKTLKLKDKYATPRARTQMMWARVVSDGVRAMMPSANGGRYTPEEMGDEEFPAPAAQPGDVVDAEFTVTTDEGETEAVTAVEEAAAEAQQVAETTEVAQATSATTEEAYATSEQSSRLNDLYASLSLTAEQIEKALKKRGASSNRSLKFDAAAELIATLEGKLSQVQAAQQQTISEAVGESRQNPDNVTTNPGGPATPEQTAEAKKMLAELEQIKPGTVNRFVAHIKSKGIDKLADLSAGDCAALLDGLAKKTLEAFFDRSLQTWKPKQPPVADAPFDGGMVPGESTAKN